jgi:hypothetical protein
MPLITVTSEKNNRYIALLDGKELGILIYPKWYSQDAEIVIGRTQYIIKNKGFWRTDSEVLKGGKMLFRIKTKWRGTMIIKFNEPHHPYMLEPKGWFSNGYVLKDYTGKDVFVMTQEFSWKKWSSGFEACSHIDMEDEDSKVLLMVSLHYYRSALNAAATGVVAAT